MTKLIPVLFAALILQAACNNAPNETKTATTPSADSTQTTTSTTQPAAPPANFKHATAKVNGVDVHYVIGGQGEPLVLLHGFGQNWYMWNRLLPEFSKHFTVIAPDLPGLGESGKPDSGYDKKTLATYIHGVVKQLGYEHINLAGHDIGLMVAYAYAAQFSTEVNKLALMDALLPGVEPVWSQVKGSAWWFGFFSFPASGELVAGRERLFLTNFWPVVGHVKDPFTPEEVNEFVRAYAVKGGTTGAFHWFGAFEQDAKDNKVFMKTKLKMPLLAMGGEYFGAGFLVDHCKLVAENVKGSNIKGAGHWVVQENTAQVQKDLLDFFLSK
ncbi:alpha/beta hydrolase fold protein [Niastella koreensis GR20-10]|uniref:Alpha/beta hydrolase fold protein n=2 Tax=Niastella koreensis TaxID=354356 RepID=G8TFQ4_NIAKG|nr:alpha/beta hydrolase [Niastella koreensis]AEV99493.1 alpha/beta hydrolase fold protein [Niastella koreensis GR20-10]